MTELSFIERSTLDIIDFIIGDILSDCFLTIDEKTSLSRRQLVYEKSFLEECREFQVIFPDHFPPENNDCVYQTIPIGLFFETFGQEADLKESEKISKLTETKMKGHFGVDVSTAKTDGKCFSFEPSHEKHLNTDYLESNFHFKGKKTIYNLVGGFYKYISLLSFWLILKSFIFSPHKFFQNIIISRLDQFLPFPGLCKGKYEQVINGAALPMQ